MTVCYKLLIQVTKCRLTEVNVPDGRWSPEAVLLVKEAVLGAEDCKITVTFYDVQFVLSHPQSELHYDMI